MNSNHMTSPQELTEPGDEYAAFLATKIPKAEVAGFAPPTPCHPSLFPHQRDICEWAIRGGRRAIFANFGLGKTRMHLQLASWVCAHTGGKYLIVAPLGVRQEFTASDGPQMGIAVRYVKTNEEAQAATERVLITNYERVRDGDIDLSQFAGAGLDEASCLRSYGSKTYQSFLGLFKVVKYRFVFTATPSPNRYKELIHYGGFLGVMDTGEALTRFFQRDSSEAGNLTLYPHMEDKFWLWLSSWAVFITRPSDLGYSDEGYDLPPMKVHWHRVEVDHRKAWEQFDSWGQAQLLQNQSIGLKQAAATKRETIEKRVEKARDIISREPLGKHWVIWHDLETEREVIEEQFPLAKTVYGSQDLDDREELILGFGNGDYRILATKPSIAGSGCNFQRHCADEIFIGVGYKFNDLIQAIHRVHRFQQKKQVNIHIIYCDSEDEIRAELEAKWKRHDELMERMSELLRKNRLTTEGIMRLEKSMGVNAPWRQVKDSPL